jgi:LPXTG-motif cell wall-anchored protein
MINIHHDSWIWLSNWDGDTSSEEYRMYTDFWAQLADYFKDEPAQVCFETINEPSFSATGSITKYDKLDAINKAAYDVIRNTPGNETRMIVMPTLSTNHEESNSKPLAKLIKELDDSYVIATVHYYSEWVYSANLGKTSFDEVLWGDNYTARAAADSLMATLKEQFFDNGISVIIGEYGLLGYDASEGCLQTGEELKYYEYMNYLAEQNNVCLMFWDNGSGIDRNSSDYSWKNERVGNMLEASMSGRSSYATDLDTVYYNGEATEDTKISLTLNGNTFTGIEGLTEGTDYTYDESTATVTLKKEFINEKYNALNMARMETYGTFADLVFTFSSGADWHQYLVKYGESVIGEAEGSVGTGISIPVDFNGRQVKRVTAYQTSGKVGPNSSWWDYLQNASSFSVDYENGTINFLSDFFGDSTVSDGLIMATVEYYDGGTDKVWMSVEDSEVLSSEELAVNIDDVNWLATDTICLYAGETEIPSQYVNAPEGYTIRVVDGFSNSDMVTLVGDWPQYMEFDTVAHDKFESAMLRLSYMDISKDLTVSVGIKNAPVVSDASLKTGTTTTLSVANLADDAILTYTVADPSVATVAADGTVTGLKAGTTKVTVTVSQYGRVDDFEGEILVTESAAANQPSNQPSNDDNANASTEAPAETVEPSTEAPAVTVAPSTEAPAATVAPSTAAPAATTTSPQTGDSTPVAVAFAFMMLSGIAFVLLRKKNKEM